MNPHKSSSIVVAFALLALSAGNTVAAPLSTAFTYQGRLTDGTNLANGSYDFLYLLFNTNSGGSVCAGPVTNTAIAVASGLFTTPVDFGADVFDGAAHWLEIRVRTNGAGAFTLLSPRQELTPAPQALFACGAAVAASANSLPTNAVMNWNIAPDQLTRSINNLRDDVTLVGDGVDIMTNANTIIIRKAANCLDYTNCYWNLHGNGNIGGGVHFLGTIADELAPLELRVNNHRSMLYLYTAPSDSPNLVGGYVLNEVSEGVTGGTICGGGRGYHVPGSPEPYEANSAGSDYSSIGGGADNIVGTNSPWSTIGAGWHNWIGHGAYASTIGGGSNNLINSSSASSTIGGGTLNWIQTNSLAAAIGGGWGNSIGSGASASMIGGGSNNLIAAASAYATIGGGTSNWIQSNAFGATISGGTSNWIRSAAPWTIIGGGTSNRIGINAPGSAILGGMGNAIASEATNSSVGGGSANRIESSSVWSTVAGGGFNTISSYSRASTVSGGWTNTVSGSFSTVGGGGSNTVVTTGSTIAGGTANTIDNAAQGSSIGGGEGNAIGISDEYATIGGGAGNLVSTNSPYAFIPGGYRAKTTHYGQMAHAAGSFAAKGDAQTSVYVLRGTTTGTSTNAELFLNPDYVPEGRMILEDNSSWTFDALVVGRSSTGTSAGFEFHGVVSRVEDEIYMVFWEHKGTSPMGPGSIWYAYASTDPDWHALTIKVWGQGGQDIRWVASVRTVEVIY
jgi:hypothetical protein